MNEILAKSKENGGTLLIDHLKQVAFTAQTIARKLGFAEDEIELAYRAGILHDIGKAHPEFQKRLRGKKPEPSEIALRHEISSLLFLGFFPKDNWPKIVEYVIAHHKSIGDKTTETFGNKGIVSLCNFNDPTTVFEIHTRDWEFWSISALEILTQCGIYAYPIPIEEARKSFDYVFSFCEEIITRNENGWSQRKGLMVAADQFASALIDKTYSQAEKIFKAPNLNYFETRESDLYPLSKRLTVDPRPHTLVKAPTGAGKTDFLMRRCRGRVFYTLPFQASINSMYRRFKQAMPTEDIRLLHASSSISVDGYEEKVLQNHVGAGIKVLTPHQLAALITGVRGFESIAIDISGSDVILDEIHSYSEESQAMVMEIVRILLKHSCRIHIGTATMPSTLENYVFRLLGGSEKVYKVDLSGDEISTFNRHLVYKHQAFEETLGLIESGLKNNEKVLIVCNRVKSAQERFEMIKEMFPNVKKLLLHSRFKRIDRGEKEIELTKMFNEPDSCIVVSTQVVEVSLDISADLMITECAPLDALIQRFGRVNRKRSGETIGKFKPVHVIKPAESIKEAKPYNLEILMRSFEELPDGELLKEDELQKKLDVVYPELSILKRDVHFVWKNDRFSMYKLCHLPKSILMELMNIESQAVILKSEENQYLEGNREVRSALEIPVPRNAAFYKFTNFGRLEVGTRPFVVHDDLYNQEKGFEFREIDNFI